jgi:hypothetical protein
MRVACSTSFGMLRNVMNALGRPIKRKRFLIFLALIALAGGVYWFYPSKPTINFVRLETENGIKQAVFRVKNDTRYSFIYSARNLNDPLCSYRTLSASGWSSAFPTCGMGTKPYQVNARDSFEFKALIPFDPGDAPYCVGVYFERGTLEECTERNKKYWERDHNNSGPTFLAQIYYKIGSYLPASLSDPTTWSESIQP